MDDIKLLEGGESTSEPTLTNDLSEYSPISHPSRRHWCEFRSSRTSESRGGKRSEFPLELSSHLFISKHQRGHYRRQQTACVEGRLTNAVEVGKVDDGGDHAGFIDNLPNRRLTEAAAKEEE